MPKDRAQTQEPQTAQDTSAPQGDTAAELDSAAPSTEQLAQSPTWGLGGRYVINPATGERESAAAQE